MRAGLEGMFLETGQQAVSVALVPFLLPDGDILQMSNPAAERVPEAPDPITHLVAEDEVVVLEVSGITGGLLLTHGEVVEPVGKLLALLHFADRQFTHFGVLGISHVVVLESAQERWVRFAAPLGMSPA
jgi:hypothetical protein